MIEERITASETGQTDVVVKERRAMGAGAHMGVELTIITNGRGTGVELLDDEALEVAAALRYAVQEGAES